MNYLFLRLNDTFSNFSFNFCLVFPQRNCFVKIGFYFILYYTVSSRFGEFRFASVNFVSFRYISFRFTFYRYLWRFSVCADQ